MEQTTITINGEECVILPAPKGAFVTRDNYPYFVSYVAVSKDVVAINRYNNSLVKLNVFPLSRYDGIDFVLWDKDETFFTEVEGDILGWIYDKQIEYDQEPRETLMWLYQRFKSHGTPMDDTAIKWLKEKFKEHNITKADFDVFA